MLTAYASAALMRLVHAQIAVARLNAAESTQVVSVDAAGTSDVLPISHKGDKRDSS